MIVSVVLFDGPFGADKCDTCIVGEVLRSSGSANANERWNWMWKICVSRFENEKDDGIAAWFEKWTLYHLKS
jgi:hypothetical protein